MEKTRKALKFHQFQIIQRKRYGGHEKESIYEKLKCHRSAAAQSRHYCDEKEEVLSALNQKRGMGRLLNNGSKHCGGIRLLIVLKSSRE